VCAAAMFGSTGLTRIRAVGNARAVSLFVGNSEDLAGVRSHVGERRRGSRAGATSRYRSSYRKTPLQGFAGAMLETRQGFRSSANTRTRIGGDEREAKRVRPAGGYPRERRSRCVPNPRNQRTKASKACVTIVLPVLTQVPLYSFSTLFHRESHCLALPGELVCSDPRSCPRTPVASR
jgi:hypothetical protein